MSSLLRRPAGPGDDAEQLADDPLADADPADAQPDAGQLDVGQLNVVELDDDNRTELTQLVDADPIVNAVLSARLAVLPTLSARRFGGQLIGVRDAAGRLRAAAFNGGNLLPVAGRPDELAALGQYLATRPRVCSSIVGPAASVRSLWDELAVAWGPQRAIRDTQPLLVLDSGAAAALGGDPRVRPVLPGEVDAYVPAAAAMFTEELGISPYACVAAGDYRRRVAGLIRDRRAFAVLDTGGEVVFKADLGAVSPHTCQVQGVWVRPDLRGRGFGTAALASVLRHAATVAPTVSLYVNDFNVAARRMYDTLGMRQIETFTTILF